MAKRRKRSREDIARDWTLRAFGLAGIVYETVAEKIDRPYLLALFAGLVGLPWYIQRDEKRNSDEDE